MDIFKRASKNKLRFDTAIGTLTTEDLWDLNLSGGRVSLDEIAKALNKMIKESEEESFVEDSKIDPSLKLSFEIVKSIIDAKVADKKKSEKAIATKERNQKILDIMSRKQDADLESKSYEELQELLNED